MKRRAGLGITLGMCAAAEAAEPVATPVPAVVPVSKPAPAKHLDLRIGDIRTYMMPAEFQAALSEPDADKNTVVVEGKQELLPVKYEKPIPMGPLLPLIWALMNPASSWRILFPDIHRVEPGPPDVVPPPEFRWGP